MGNAIDYNNWKEEKINGKIYYMSPSANPKHSKVIFNLALAFGNYLKGKTCEVYTDNLDIYLDDKDDNYVIPDMSVLCDPSKFKDNGYHGIPSLIVEVISPTSLRRDRFEKFELYQKVGVKEFWLVDYQSKSIEQYILTNGVYKPLNLLTIVSDYDYEKRLTEEEKQNYTTIIKPSIFNDLEIDIIDIFS